MCMHPPPPPPDGTSQRVTVAALHARRPFSWLWLAGSSTFTPNCPGAQIAKFTPPFILDGLFHPQSGS